MPHQYMPFSAGLKRCEGTCLPPNMPPAFFSHSRSQMLAMLSFRKVMSTITSDTANSGPAKLWMFLSR